MMNWTSFRAFERGYVTEAPIRDIPRIGSAYKPIGYSSHPSNPLSILLVFCRINRDRCPYLGESRSTTAARSTPITRAGGRLPCRPTNSLRLPTRRTVSFPCLACAPKSSTFILQGISRPRARTRPTMVSVCPAVPIQSLRGHRGSPDSLPSRMRVDSGPYQQVQPGGVTLDSALEMVRRSHQWKELKRIVLVSPQGCQDTNGTN